MERLVVRRLVGLRRRLGLLRRAETPLLRRALRRLGLLRRVGLDRRREAETRVGLRRLGLLLRPRVGLLPPVQGAVATLSAAIPRSFCKARTAALVFSNCRSLRVLEFSRGLYPVARELDAARVRLGML